MPIGRFVRKIKHKPLGHHDGPGIRGPMVRDKPEKKEGPNPKASEKEK